MKSNDGVSKVGVQTHSWGETEGQIGEETHQKGGKAGNGGSSGDHVELQDTEAIIVDRVGGAIIGDIATVVADTGSTRVCHDQGVDRDNVGLLCLEDKGRKR